MAADPAAEDVEAVDERIVAFHKMGFSEFSAFLLAWSPVSIAEMRELLKHGCPLDLAMQIKL